MRIRYLVCYDIAHPRRLRRVAKAVEGYGYRLQFSVFECALDKMRFAELKAELDKEIKHDEDQVMFVSLGQSSNDDNVTIETIGLPYTGRTKTTIV